MSKVVNKNCLKLYPSTSYSLQKKTITLQWRNTANTTLMWSKLTPPIIHMDIMYLDIMHQEGHMIFAVFLPKYNFNLVVRQSQFEGHYINNWQVLYPSVKIIKNKGWRTAVYRLKTTRHTMGSWTECWAGKKKTFLEQMAQVK